MLRDNINNINVTSEQVLITPEALKVNFLLPIMPCL